MKNYIEVEYGDHVVTNLHIVDTHVRRRAKDAVDMRWIVIGLHDALYALLAEKLTRSDGFGIFRRDFEKEVQEFYESGKDSNSAEFHALCEKSFNVQTASLRDLLIRAKLPSNPELISTEIQKSEKPTRGLSWLKQLRDYHAHPRPMLLAIHTELLFEAIADTVEVIREATALPDQRYIHKSTGEIELLLNSINFYASKWRDEIQAETN